MNNKKILLEVFTEGDQWMPCHYMTRVVQAVVDNYSDILDWKKVSTKERAGAMRYKEFSAAIKKLAPIPSIVIENELVFESIPSVEDLEFRINKSILKIKQRR